jgi:hypothetical protein
MYTVKLLLFLLVVVHSGQAIKIVQTSPKQLVKKGDNVVLFCR